MTTFTDTFTGADGSLPSATDWIVENTTGSTSTIQSNALQMVTGAIGGYADKTILTWAGAAASDVEIDLDITPASTAESYFEFALRATNSGSSMTQNGYRFEVAFNGFVQIIRQDNFASTTLASGVQVAGFGAGVTVHVQASAYGSTLTLYAWTGSTRPNTPTLQAVDATWRNAGYVVFEVLGGNAAAAQTWTVDNATIDVAVHGGRVGQYGGGLPSATPFGLGRPRFVLPAMSSGTVAAAIVDLSDTDTASAVDTSTADVSIASSDTATSTDAVSVASKTAADAATSATFAISAPSRLRGVNNSDGAYNVKFDGVWGTFPGTYGTHWHYDAPASLTYLASRGMQTTRLAFAWERLQPTRGAALDSAEVARITGYLDSCQAVGIRVVIEPHSYARYREGAYPTPGITLRTLGVDLTASEMADLWTRMVAAFGAHPALHGWELTNEPYDLPSTNLAGTFAATWDTTLSGWGNGITNCTIARSTSNTRTGAGALQMTTTANTAGDTYAQAWFATGGAGSLTFSAYVRSLGAARSAQFVINWYDSSLAYITSTATGFISATSTTYQLVTGTVTPPGGAYRGQLSLDVLGAQAGEVFLWDDLTSNALAVQTGAQLWEATSQTLVTAIRNAKDNHVIYVPGYNWQDPRSWPDNHPTPFVTDPTSNIKYSAHFYFDDTDNGTYAATYAQENTNAIAQGFTSVTDRTVSNINRFVSWCTLYGVNGAFTELGWPHNADATLWNATTEAVYRKLDQVGMDAWVWTTGELYGTTSPLNPYDTGAGSTLSSANAQAPVIEAHLLGIGFLETATGTTTDAAAVTVLVTSADTAAATDTSSLRAIASVEAASSADTLFAKTISSIPDTASSTDTGVTSASVSNSDSATSTDTITFVNVSASETGSATDTAGSRTFTDVESSVAFDATLVMSLATGDVASSADAGSASSTGATPVSDTDTAASTDISTARDAATTETASSTDVTSSKSFTTIEIAVAVDASTLSIAAASAETSTASDTSTLSAGTTSAEIGTSADASSVLVSLTTTDVATSADAIASRALADLDTATSIDASTGRTLTSSESASTTDVVSSFSGSSNPQASDTATTTDTAQVVVAVAATDTASSSEAGQLGLIARADSDSASTTDTMQTGGVVVGATDFAVCTESSNLFMASTKAETAASSDANQLSALLALSDSGTVADVLTTRALLTRDTATSDDAISVFADSSTLPQALSFKSAAPNSYAVVKYGPTAYTTKGKGGTVLTY